MGSNVKKDTPLWPGGFPPPGRGTARGPARVPLADLPHNAVLRHPENRKWYAVLMQVSREKLGLAGAGPVDIVDLKCDPALVRP